MSKETEDNGVVSKPMGGLYAGGAPAQPSEAQRREIEAHKKSTEALEKHDKALDYYKVLQNLNAS